VWAHGSAKERVVEETPRTSSYARGPTLYETVEVRYANRALLLLLGVPPARFMTHVGKGA
jgi:hypothetical protein